MNRNPRATVRQPSGRAGAHLTRPLLTGLGIAGLALAVTASPVAGASANHLDARPTAAGQPGPATPSPSTRDAGKPAPLRRAPAGAALAGRYVVVLDPGTSARGRLGAGAGQVRGRVLRRLHGSGVVARTQYGSAVNGFAATLTTEQLAAVRADPEVGYVAEDARVRIDTAQLPATWGLDRVDQRALPLNDAYVYDRTGAGVTAYVIDTGIRTTHNQFGGRATGGYTSVSDGNGTNDCNGHGTHVAGTIGGSTHGVAKGVRLVAVRVLGCTGSGSMSAVIAGVDWVTANHQTPAVANMSLGANAYQALDDAVTRSIAAGVTYAVSAGNSNTDACNQSPARTPAAITTGATTRADSRDTSYSNFGSCLDLFAPGSSITSAWNSSDTATGTLSGTSMAAPHVTGVAALYLQAHPGAYPSAVRDALVTTATTGVVANAGSGSPNRLLYSSPQKIALPPGPTQPDRLLPGQGLRRGQQLCSGNGLYCLVQQSADGNLVLYKPGGRALWATYKPAAFTVMQADGNLVSYDPYGVPLWNSKTYGSGSSTLFLQDDANLVVRRAYDGRATWNSGTAQAIAPAQPSGRTDRLSAGQALYRGGNTLTSADGRFTLVLQRSDGNLVLYRNGVGALWSTGPKDSDWFSDQSDGNLVVYRSTPTSLWSSGTAGQGAGTLTLQNDGNLVLYRDSDRSVLWASDTAGY